MREFIRSIKSNRSIRARGRRVAGAPNGDASARVERPRVRQARWGLTALLVVGALILGHAWAPTIHAAGPLTVSDCSSEYGSGGTQANPASGSLLAAVNQANTDNAGDPISITCSGTIPLTSTLTITGGMSITGPTGSSPAVALDGGATAQPARVVQDLVVQTGANLTLTDLIISGGTATNGGGIDNQTGAQLTLNNDVVAGNSATGGGGIENTGGTLNVNNSTFSGNVATGGGSNGIGGAIENDSGGQVSISGSTFTGNSTGSGPGGAIENTGGMSTLHVDTSAFTSNSTNTSGGGGGTGGAIENAFGGAATISASAFTSNAVNNGSGGAIDNNSANGSGGTAASTLSITASTFTGNSAFSGGAIANFGSTATITASTLSGNSAGNGGNSITNYPSAPGTVSIGGSIVASASGGNCVGAITDQRYNLEWSGSGNSDTCGFSAANNDLTGQDPQLGSLANNGGPTQTLALQQGSPAIDQIPASSCLSSDQRGTTRPDNGEASCDIGAYEYVDPADADLGLTGVPNNISVTTAGTGAVVTYTAPTATDESGDSPAASVSCDHASGSTFGIGNTTVTCTATDSDDTPNTVSATFTVTVKVSDTDLAITPSTVPANQTVNATSPQGAVVTYTAPTATDESGDSSTATVSCARSDHPATASAPFPIGTTTVTCTASDNDDTNSPVHASFTVTVLGAATQVSNLLTTVNGYTNPALTATQKTTLDNKLNEILAEINGGQKALACNNLLGFIGYVKAQTGKGGITATRATALIAAAKNIQAVLGC